jgi:hypothetical protein
MIFHRGIYRHGLAPYGDDFIVFFAAGRNIIGWNVWNASQKFLLFLRHLVDHDIVFLDAVTKLAQTFRPL